MKPCPNPFLNRLVSVGLFLTLGQAVRADIFDTNGTTSGFGVTNGSTYDWWTANSWSNTATVNDGTAAVVTWQGTSTVSEQAFFVGSGTAGQNYTVRLGATGSTDTYVQNLAINVNAAGNAALTGAAGNVTIGNTGDTGKLIIRASNSVGAQNSGTLTINNLVDLNAQTLNFRGGNIVINGNVSGTGASNISSGGGFGLAAGTLTLAGNNSFAGSVTAGAGYVVSLQHANALGATGGTNSVIATGTMEVAGGITLASGESIGIAGDGVSFVGALRAGTGGGTWAGGVTLNGTGAGPRIGATAGNALTITGTIANGSGTSFNVSGQSGTGVVILNPTTSNSYTGTTGIIRGILRLGKTDALPTGTTLDVDSANSVTDAATFDMAGFNQTVAALQDTAGSNINGKITNSVVSTTSTLTINQASNTTYDGIIENGSGSVVLTKGGAGNLTLTGANTFTGGTNIKNGSIIISGNNDRLATGGSVVLGDVATSGKLILGDATSARNQTLASLTVTGLGGSVVGAHATNNSTLTLNIASGTSTFGGTLGGAGTNENKLALAKTGAGTLELLSSNTFTGGATISGGTLLASDTASLGAAGQIVTLSSGGGFGTLNLATDTSANAYVLNFGSLAGSGGTVVVNRATSGAAITHTMGTVTMGNAKFNVQAGANVTSGTPTLELAGINLTAGVTGDGVATLVPTTANILVSGNITRTGGSSNSLVLDGTSTGNLISGIISGSQTLTKSNVGTWELSNANTFTGKTLVTGGTLKLTNSLAIQSSAFDTSGAGTLDLSTVNTPTFGGLTSATDYALPSNVSNLTLNPSSGATHTYTGILSGGVSGLTLTKTGAGTQILGGANNYSGLTTISGGELRLTHASAIGGTNVTVTAGQLALDGSITVSGKSLTTSGSGTNFIGGLQSFSGTNEWAGNVLLGADNSRLGARRDATLVVSGTIDDGASTYNLVVRNENQNNTSGAGNSTTITEISGVNTYGGNTQIIAGITRLGGGDNRLPTGTTLQFGGSGANAKFDMNGRNQEVAGLAVMSNSTDTQRDWNANELTNSSGTLSTLTVNTSTDQTFGLTTTSFGGSENYTGIITGNIALEKSGSANLTLSGINTYTGATNVTAGTLTVSSTGSLATGSAVTVENNATLSVAGTINGTTTVDAGGTLTGNLGTFNSSVTINGTHSPGASPGLQTLASGLSYGSTAILNFELVGDTLGIRGTDYDGINVTGGDLSINSLAALHLLGTGIDYSLAAWDIDRAFTVIDFTSAGTSNGIFLLNTTSAGPFAGEGTWSLANTGGDVVLSWAAVPEPASTLLAGLGCLILMGRRRRPSSHPTGNH